MASRSVHDPGPIPEALRSGQDPRLRCLLDSYARFAGRPLCAAEELFEADFVVLSHGLQDPPILWYGNRAALQLWERSWAEFTRMPSRETAEPDAREVRAQFLAEVAAKGFTSGYTGVRVSKSGQRFLIRDAFVWNVLDAEGRRLGQAATFHQTESLPPLSPRAAGAP